MKYADYQAETKKSEDGDFEPRGLTLQECWKGEFRSGDYTSLPEYVNLTEDEQMEFENAYSRELSLDELSNRAFERCMEQGFYIADGKETRAIVERKSIDELAAEAWQGLWGNGQERIDRLTEAGYDAAAVQQRINETA